MIVQNYDINYGTEARHEDGPYADSHMDYNDWKVNEHSVAEIFPAATVVNDSEGTKYVTASLVLPSVYMLIHKVRKGEIVCNCDDSDVQPQQTTPDVRAARANLRTALDDRFIRALPDHVFEQYSIATLLDPRLKSFRFLSQGQRDTPIEAFRAQWTQKWQPQHAERPQPKPAAQKKTGVSPTCARVTTGAGLIIFLRLTEQRLFPQPVDQFLTELRLFLLYVPFESLFRSLLNLRNLPE